ncbi:hypothetical protein HN419_05305 [Candidatus Woesearchaeota archaeon]|jgi:hypothetical protein|nr:hypothetical protein [Candidatus Woesearchaeota archaeon]MBT3537711.1 hypothetical protein [Candidatus Woesearchaeota archaeon]MBT4697842.1 hypothetical protein [Candidatus Woesearchaeota archaeon]MBT4717498.1 hypothetical protein [Candidatus Woesearchaeota archaeon]MBT7105380.1 hypothetical protein [Candidatus Woesearchaeota archaeon]
MKKLYFLLLITIIAAIGCSTVEEPKQLCNAPYIEFMAGECCLDADNNSICDSDEISEDLSTSQPIEVLVEETDNLLIEESLLIVPADDLISFIDSVINIALEFRENDWGFRLNKFGLHNYDVPVESKYDFYDSPYATIFIFDHNITDKAITSAVNARYADFKLFMEYKYNTSQYKIKFGRYPEYTTSDFKIEFVFETEDLLEDNNLFTFKRGAIVTNVVQGDQFDGDDFYGAWGLTRFYVPCGANAFVEIYPSAYADSGEWDWSMDELKEALENDDVNNRDVALQISNYCSQVDLVEYNSKRATVKDSPTLEILKGITSVSCEGRQLTFVCDKKSMKCYGGGCTNTFKKWRDEEKECFDNEDYALFKHYRVTKGCQDLPNWLG